MTTFLVIICVDLNLFVVTFLLQSDWRFIFIEARLLCASEWNQMIGCCEVVGFLF